MVNRTKSAGPASDSATGTQNTTPAGGASRRFTAVAGFLNDSTNPCSSDVPVVLNEDADPRAKMAWAKGQLDCVNTLLFYVACTFEGNEIQAGEVVSSLSNLTQQAMVVLQSAETGFHEEARDRGNVRRLGERA